VSNLAITAQLAACFLSLSATGVMERFNNCMQNNAFQTHIFHWALVHLLAANMKLTHYPTDGDFESFHFTIQIYGPVCT
jgi:hypothetical protein